MNYLGIIFVCLGGIGYLLLQMNSERKFLSYSRFKSIRFLSILSFLAGSYFCLVQLFDHP